MIKSIFTHMLTGKNPRVVFLGELPEAAKRLQNYTKTAAEVMAERSKLRHFAFKIFDFAAYRAGEKSDFKWYHVVTNDFNELFDSFSLNVIGSADSIIDLDEMRYLKSRSGNHLGLDPEWVELLKEWPIVSASDLDDIVNTAKAV